LDDWLAPDLGLCLTIIAAIQVTRMPAAKSRPYTELIVERPPGQMMTLPVL